MKVISKIKNNNVIRNSITLINGAVIAQAINFLISPVISRIYKPEDFGSYSSLLAIVSILSVITTLKLDLAIMDKKKNKQETKNVYYLAMICNTLICLLITTIGIILSFLSIIKLLDIIFVTSMTFFTGVNTIISVWLNKYEHYKVLKTNKIIYSLFHAIMIIVFGILKLEYLGLILASIIGFIMQFIHGFVFLYKKTDFSVYKFNKQSLKENIKKYRNLPLFQMPALLLNTAATQFPIVILRKLLDSIVAGFYSMTVRIINLPMLIIGQAIGDVYFKEASTIKASNNLSKLQDFTMSIYKKVLIIGIIPMGILAGYGDILFSLVLGKDWYMAGVYSMILAPSYYLNFITAPFSNLFVVMNKQKSNLFLNSIFLITKVGSIALGVLLFNHNPLPIIMIYSIMCFIVWLFANGYILKLVNIRFTKSICLALITFLFGTLIFLVPRLIYMIICNFF